MDFSGENSCVRTKICLIFGELKYPVLQVICSVLKSVLWRISFPYWTTPLKLFLAHAIWHICILFHLPFLTMNAEEWKPLWEPVVFQTEKDNTKQNLSENYRWVAALFVAWERWQHDLTEITYEFTKVRHKWRTRILWCFLSEAGMKI